MDQKITQKLHRASYCVTVRFIMHHGMSRSVTECHKTSWNVIFSEMMNSYVKYLIIFTLRCKNLLLVIVIFLSIFVKKCLLKPISFKNNLKSPIDPKICTVQLSIFCKQKEFETNSGTYRRVQYFKHPHKKAVH